MIKAKWSAPGEEYSQAAQVRLAVFVAEQGYPKDLEFDELDSGAWHLTLFDGASPVAAARLVTLSPGVLKLGGLPCCGNTASSILVHASWKSSSKKAEELGARELHIGAQVQAHGVL